MRFWKLFFWIPGPALLALFIATMLMVAYPNAFEVGAPFLCPDDKADPFVVRYDVQTSDGTGTNWTLFCMSDRGEIEEAGTWKPLFILFLIVAALVYGLLILRLAVRLIRGIGGGGGGPPDGGEPLVLTADQLAGTQAQPDPFEAIRDQQGPIIS